MKKAKTFIRTALMAAFILSTTGCSEDAELVFFSGEQLIDQIGTCTNVVSTVRLYLNGTEEQSLGIAYGKGSYSATSADYDIATADISNNRLKLKGLKPGETQVTVTDKKGNSATLSVKVGMGCVSLQHLQMRLYLTQNDQLIDDKSLKEQVGEAMKAQLSKDNYIAFVIVPRHVSTWIEGGTSELYAYMLDEDAPSIGTCQAVQPSNERVVLAFQYGESLHHYECNPPFLPAKEMAGGYQWNFVEDVTRQCPDGLLKEGMKVYYGFSAQTSGMDLMEESI